LYASCGGFLRLRALDFLRLGLPANNAFLECLNNEYSQIPMRTRSIVPYLLAAVPA
jgi:hypothetical protein